MASDVTASEVIEVKVSEVTASEAIEVMHSLTI